MSVYREEKQFLTYLKFLSPFFVDCDTLALFLYDFFKLWIFLKKKKLIYRNGYVTISNPQWNIKVLFSILSVCHRSKINDSVTMNSCFRTVFAH